MSNAAEIDNATDDTIDSSYAMSDDEYLEAPEPSTASDNTEDDTDANSKDKDTVESEFDDVNTTSQEEEDNDTASDEDADPDESPLGDEDKESESSEDALDYDNIGKQIMSEFKANGKVMKMRSAEDAITLMQMGANYHKKMSTLKPAMKILKLLEKNGLMDDDKINYLIDLNQNKPEAIAKLMHDSKLDPMDMDLEDTQNYSPERREVSDVELQLDDVLDQIQQSPTAARTLHIIGDEWDEKSKQFMAQNPNIITVINEHMETGIYDQVAAAVEYERSLGNLVNVSDFDAYQQTGKYMEENNLFATSASVGAQTKSTSNKTNKISATNNASENIRKSRKKAAGSTRISKKPAKASTDVFSLSDEEFMKLDSLQI